MDWNRRTIQTYDYAADKLAEYFHSIGPRVDDIEKALKLAGANSGGRVVEIGCGDGRDAVEIVKRVDRYEGFDPSREMLNIAKQRLPQETFVQTDALSYSYPSNVDVILAFASLLHVDKRDIRKVFRKVAASLRPGGILYFYLKERPEYTEEVKKDEYGERMYYYYNIGLIKELANGLLVTVYEGRYKIGNTNWLTMALKRD